MDPVRLACVRHAASVRPEPGSNSPSKTIGPAPPRWHGASDQKSRHRAGTRRQLAQSWHPRPRPRVVRSCAKGIEGSIVAPEGARLPALAFWHPVFRCQGAPATASGASARNVALPEVPYRAPAGGAGPPCGADGEPTHIPQGSQLGIRETPVTSDPRCRRPLRPRPPGGGTCPGAAGRTCPAGAPRHRAGGRARRDGPPGGPG